MKWLLISFIAWIPHEKEVWSIIRKAERAELKNVLIEKLNKPYFERQCEKSPEVQGAERNLVFENIFRDKMGI